MKRNVLWSERALADFEGQFAYIARDNLRNAILVADRIDHSVGVLADMPFGRPGRVAGTYEALIPKIPFIVVYELPDDRTLAIRRVIHAARHWPAGAWPDDDEK
jgi:toxin ParE1/3/4